MQELVNLLRTLYLISKNSEEHEVAIDEDTLKLMLDTLQNKAQFYIKDLTQKTDELIKQNLLKAFADHDYPITYHDGSRGRGMGYGDFEKLINDFT